MLRSFASAAILVGAYYLLPIGTETGTAMYLRLLAGIVLFGVVIAVQVRNITGAKFPILRAIEAVSVAIPLILVLFATTYLTMSQSSGGNFTEPLSQTGALYFTITIFATVGFGDIAPVTDGARIVASIQMIFDLIALGIVVRLLFGVAATHGTRRTPGHLTPGQALHSGLPATRTNAPSAEAPDAG